MKIFTTLSALRAVATFAPSSDPRYYLVGVQVRANANETRIAATDGHAMGIHSAKVANEDVSSVELIMPLDLIKLLKPASRSIDDVIIETPDGLTGTISVVGGATIAFQAIDGKFPDVDRVIPATTDGKPAQYNPALLMNFQKAAKHLGSKNGLIHVAYNGNGGALVSIDSCETFVGVVMPFRSIGGFTTAPAWAKQAPVAVAA